MSRGVACYNSILERWHTWTQLPGYSRRGMDVPTTLGKYNLSSPSRCSRFVCLWHTNIILAGTSSDLLCRNMGKLVAKRIAATAFFHWHTTDSNELESDYYLICHHTIFYIRTHTHDSLVCRDKTRPLSRNDVCGIQSSGTGNISTVLPQKDLTGQGYQQPYPVSYL